MRPAMSAGAGPVELGVLLQRTAGGDRAAFAAAYRAMAPQLFGLALRMLRQRDLAEDVLQEVFVIIWNKAAGFDPAKGSAQAWMATILRNRCLDRLRTRRPETSIEEAPAAADWADPAAGPLDRALSSAAAKALGRCLEQLEHGPRNAILRVYFEGLTHAEIAAKTSTPPGTVKSWVRRGLMRLKDCLAA
jgi:RNA polymerase sigma-70 factor (ECF subfamily)